MHECHPASYTFIMCGSTILIYIVMDISGRRLDILRQGNLSFLIKINKQAKRHHDTIQGRTHAPGTNMTFSNISRSTRGQYHLSDRQSSSFVEMRKTETYLICTSHIDWHVLNTWVSSHSGI